MVEDRVTEVTDRMASKDSRRSAGAVAAPPSPPVGPPEGTDTEGRVSWRFVAGFAAGIVVFVGAVYLLLQALRAPAPPVAALVPVATAAATVVPTRASAPVAAPTVSPTTAPASAPEVVAGATAQPATGVVAAPTRAAPTSAPTLSVATAGVVQVATPVGEVAPPAPNVDPALARAVITGYLRYWTVREQALTDPGGADPGLEDVMAGTELARARQVLAEYAQGGTAYRTDVKHQIQLTQITVENAEVSDQYTVSSMKLDPTTKEPVSADPIIEHIHTTFFLQKFDDAWKVIDQHGEG